MGDLEKCTSAIPLGGNRFADKSGTPDVMGVFRFSEADPLKPLPEIVSVEVKTDTSQLITAFGQARAYKLFCHKVYLVIPQYVEDIGRIESLRLRFGIGLVIFDSQDSSNPNYKIRRGAIKSEPDCFYLNQHIRKLPDADIKKLFR